MAPDYCAGGAAGLALALWAFFGAGAIRDCRLAPAVSSTTVPSSSLSTAHSALGDEVEVSGLTLGPALTRRDAAGVDLVRPIRGQVVLDVDRALRTQGLLFTTSFSSV